MTKQRILAVLAGVIGAMSLMLSAEHVNAAITWVNWGSEKPAGKTASCSGNWVGEVNGSSAINGQDSGQVVAWCAQNNVYSCGTHSVWEYYVQGRGRNELFNSYEYTGSSFGDSVKSAAGGLRLDQHQCRKGWDLR